MRLKASEVIVPEEKIIDYLLVRKNKNDKSYFLRSLGYTLENYPRSHSGYFYRFVTLYPA